MSSSGGFWLSQCPPGSDLTTRSLHGTQCDLLFLLVGVSTFPHDAYDHDDDDVGGWGVWVNGKNQPKKANEVPPRKNDDDEKRQDPRTCQKTTTTDLAQTRWTLRWSGRDDSALCPPSLGLGLHM